MGSFTLDNVVLGGRIGAAVLNFVVTLAPLVAQFF